MFREHPREHFSLKSIGFISDLGVGGPELREIITFGVPKAVPKGAAGDRQKEPPAVPKAASEAPNSGKL